MGTKQQPGEFDCYQNALPDEPMFILLARDLGAPFQVREWARLRGENIRSGSYPDSDRALVEEAYACADAMVEWRRKNKGKWREKPHAG